MNGIELEDGPIKVDAFRVVDTYGDITTVEIVVHEGRNRLVRRMMEPSATPCVNSCAPASAQSPSITSSRARLAASKAMP